MATKAVVIRTRWPLLTPTQDPEGVSARLAYHLRRQGLTTTSLKAALPPAMHNHVAEFVTGRLALTVRDVEQIAAFTGVPPIELLRPLHEDEQRAWRFYRLSAANRTEVWRRAEKAWSTLGIRPAAVARLMGLASTVICDVTQERRKHILDYPPAARLAAACALPDGADSFVAGLTFDGQKRPIRDDSNRQ